MQKDEAGPVRKGVVLCLGALWTLCHQGSEGQHIQLRDSLGLVFSHLSMLGLLTPNKNYLLTTLGNGSASCADLQHCSLGFKQVQAACNWWQLQGDVDL